jgi:hypothetical protein
MHKLFWYSVSFVWLVILPIQLANFHNYDNHTNQVENDIDVNENDCNPSLKTCDVPYLDEYEF